MAKPSGVALLVLLTVLTTDACTDSVLPPAISDAVPHVREERSSREPLGAPFSIPIPATNGFGIGGNGWVETDFVIPEGEWAHVQVIGGVSYAANPDCYYASGPCDRSLHGLTTGPLFPRGASHVRVGYQVAGQPPPDPYGSMAEFGMYPVGGSEETAMESSVLVSAYRPFKLWVRRVIVNGGSWDPFGGSAGAQYYLDGNQQLHVTIVPTPLKVGGPEVVQPGQAVQFTADIVGPFQFRRQTPWGDSIQWQYYPGDTLPEPNPYLGGIYLYECTNKPACSYTPKRNGRMGVNAQVQYNVIGVRSAVIRIDRARLQLSCDQYRVERGRSIACTAQAKPSGTLDSIRWEFVDTAGHVIRDSTGTHTWGGIMVVGGRISVTARVNGSSPTTEDTSIVVHRRRWPRPVVRPHEELATDLPPPSLVQVPSDLGDTHVDSAANPTLTTRKIETGPNAGWWYIPEHIREIPVTVHINESAFQAGSAWHNLQTGGAWTDPQTGITYPHGYCTRAQVPTLRRLTREHEGSLSSPLTSHVDTMRVYISNHAPQDSMEAVIAWDADVQTFPFDRVVRSWYRGHIIGNLTGFSAPHKPVGIVDLAPFPCAARPWN